MGNWLARVFASAVVRRCAYLFVALSLASVARCAHAQSFPFPSGCVDGGGGNPRCQTKTQAFQYVKQIQDWVAADANRHICAGPNVNDAGKAVYIAYVNGNCFNSNSRTAYWNSDDTNGCDPFAGQVSDPRTSGCLSQEKCLARNSYASGQQTRQKASFCNDGCTFKANPQGRVWHSSVGPPGAGGTLATIVINGSVTGDFSFTGDVCTDTPPPPLPNTPPSSKDNDTQTVKKDYCAPVAGQTACLQSDGKLCATGATGRRLCWTPGQTGTQTDGNTLQVSKPGIQPGDSSIALANGDTATKTNDISIKQSDRSGAQSNTTISNYQTQSGANAGPTNQGQDAQPDGTAKPGGEQNDKNGNSSGGGGDCSTPPVSQGDAILAQIAMQTWQTRCQSERQDTGAKNKGDAMEGAESGVDDSPGSVIQNANVDSGALDVNHVGTGAGGCPTPPALQIGDQTFNWPDNFCDIVAKIRMLIIACAYLAGAIMVLKR